MGSPKSELERGEDEDQVDVTLTRGFWLGKYEVTQSQYEELTRGNPSQYKRGNHITVFEVNTSSFPVENVSWDAAMSFCSKLTDQERLIGVGRLPDSWEFALPTEAQWEYACRAETKTATAFGDTLTSKQAHFHAPFPYPFKAGELMLPGDGPTKATGGYRANAWGFFDLHGNVSEWCRDGYAAKLPGGTDPIVTKLDGGRVYRGGDFMNGGGTCRSACRMCGPDGGYKADNVGFRVAIIQASR
jgi:formylglycine-generating enzyme required for sulfatase activity